MSVFRFPGDLQETDQAAKPCVFRIGQTRSTHSTLDPTGERNGGASRDRTDDLMLAKQPLSQLSYGPILVKPQAPAQASACLGFRARRRGGRSALRTSGS